MADQGIIEKIRKCLALGDKTRNPNENEVETAVRMAKMLMEQHNVSMADLVEREGKMSEEIREQSMAERAGAPNWEYDLSLVCRYLFSVQCFVRMGWPTYKKSVVFVGYETDVALAAEVYKLLKMELMTLGLRWSRSNPSPHLTPKQALVRRFKYVDGVVITLIRRAKAASGSQSVAAAAKTGALVVRKESAIAEWMGKYKLRQTQRRGTGLHGDAVAAGIKDGNSVSMNFKSAVKGTAKGNLELGYGGN